MLLQTVLKTVSRFEDPQLERVVDHTGQGGAEEFGPLGGGELTDVQPESLEAGRVGRLVDGVKADAEKVTTRSGSVTPRCLVRSQRAGLHVTGIIVPG